MSCVVYMLAAWAIGLGTGASFVYSWLNASAPNNSLNPETHRPASVPGDGERRGDD